METAWFVAMAVLAVLAAGAGWLIGRSGPQRSWAALLLGVACLGLWAYLAHHPMVAVNIFPVWLLSHIEGIAPVPIFMLVVGVFFARSEALRQKRLAVWAAILGTIYFVQGGMWMLQATPQVGFASTVTRGSVLQSQEYSCVPAACATALNTLGIYTSEQEMAQLTQTRPGTGATTIRALHGLNRRLASTPYRAELVEATLEQLRGIPKPALTPLQFERTRRHMVTITHADRLSVWIDDPMDGPLCLSWDYFAQHYTGQVITLTRTDDRRLALK